MEIKRIVPNISSNQLEKCKLFYRDLLGLQLVMDMQWILTFASPSKPSAQISIIQSNENLEINNNITVSIEVSDVDSLYQKMLSSEYEITYPITNEPWGVRRFFVSDPNGVTINILSHLAKS